MQKTRAWKTVTEGRAYSLSYSFGPGIAKCYAITFGDEVLVVSASGSMNDELFSFIESKGKVAALLAPNGLHHLGLPSWKERFPEAVIYADPGSAKRIQSKHSFVSEPSPLAELEERLSDGVTLYDQSEVMKKPDTMVTLEANEGNVLFVNDLFTNMAHLPNFLPIRIAYKLTRSGPGFEPNRLVAKVCGLNRPKFTKRVEQLIEAAPPSAIHFAHGDPLVDDATNQLKAALTRI